jgi:hypothetical protein
MKHSMKCTWITILLWIGLATVTSWAADEAERRTALKRLPERAPPAACSLQPVGEAGRYSGFDLVCGGVALAPIRFSSNALIFAANLEKRADGGLRFGGLYAAQGSGLELAGDGFVLVTPGPYPEVAFQLGVKRFDAEKWNAAAGGACPFHFLTMSLEGAQALHHRGWLVATPALDPYPLQIGRKGIVASKWSRDWTWAPPFGACPIPVVGLWAPQNKRYVAFDFTAARCTDHSEKAIASAYCWTQGAEKNFVALVYPCAQNFVGLRQPSGGETIASHFRLTYDLDLPAWEDPNQRYHERLWREYYDTLPAAPAQNDLDFLPGYAKLNDFPRVSAPRFTYTVPKKDSWESNFFEEGTVIPEIPESWPLDYFYWHKDAANLAAVKRQMPYLLGKLKKFQVNGEDCCYWEKPLEGRSKRALGDVATLRNIHGWAIADSLLCVYAHEKDASLLPVIDGVLNWTKYNICTRNDISDVPDAMFTMGWRGVDFCLRYYATFRADPDGPRAERAQMAYRLALSLAYRYTTMWIPDTAEDDNVDPTFLIEPNSGQPWTGAACANECNMFMNGFAKLYAATGDPIVLAYLRGMLERWPLLYQDVDADDIWDYGAPFAECFGIFDGCQIGRNKRSAYGGNVEPFDLIQPVGGSVVRVVAGERGAAAFNKHGRHTDIADFRSSPNLARGLSFRVVSSLTTEFDLIVTTPQFMLAGKRFLRKRDDVTSDVPASVPEYSPWNAVIHGVRDGDILALETLDLALPVIDCRPIKGWSLEPRAFSAEGFVALRLACNWAPKLDWEDNNSYAPYFADYHYAFGVPYFLVPAYLNAGKTAVVDARVSVNATARALAVFVSDVTPASRVTVYYEDGQSEDVALVETAVAWQAWPKWFKAHIDVAPHACRAAKIREIAVSGAKLWSVTLAVSDAAAVKVAHALDSTHAAQRLAKLAERERAQWLETLAQGTALSLEADCVEQGYAFCYVGVAKGLWTIPKNAFLEYDLFIPYDSIRSAGGVDLSGGTVGSVRDAGVGSHPSQSNDARGEWRHRRYDLAALGGKTFEQVVIATDGGNCPVGRYKAFFKNIRLSDSFGHEFMTFADEGAAHAEVAANGGLKGMAHWSVKTVAAAAVLGAAPPQALVMHDGVAKDDFSTYPDGSNGAPTWRIADGAWTMRNHQFIGANSAEKPSWIASGASAGDKHWSDYRLSLRFKILERGSDWRDGPWIGFRETGSGTWKYSLCFHGRDIVLHKANRGASTGDGNPLADVPWRPDAEWHRVVITARGKHIEVAVDERTLIDVTDNEHLGVPALRSGGITLCARRSAGSTGNTSVAFDEIEVRALK